MNRADLRGGALDTAAGNGAGLYFRHIRETSFSAAAGEINAVSHRRRAVAPGSSLGGANEPSAGAVSVHTCTRWGARRVTAAALISITTGSCGGMKEKRRAEMKHDVN